MNAPSQSGMVEPSEVIDSWNRERSANELLSFIQRRYQAVAGFDEIAI